MPVKYSLSLAYLSSSYVRKSDQRHRSRHLLENADGSLEGLPQIIPNVACGPDGSVDEDEVYRILITDNHTLPEMDSRLLGSTGKPSGDTVSKPGYYRRSSRRWMRDISPLVPFRIVVRKFEGSPGREEQVDLDEGLRVVLQITDPPEEARVSAQGAGGAASAFLSDFFAKYRRNGSSPGDDNCPVLFGGVRSGSEPGVKAGRVVREAPFIMPPTPETVREGELDPGRITPKAASGDMLVQLTPAVVSMEQGDNEVKVGISDFVFTPPPIGGDNYRFSLKLLDGSGNDIRVGSSATLVDEKGHVIPVNAAYCTGRFVIWRRLDIRLLLAANGLDHSLIDWNKVKNLYRDAFIEVAGPLEVKVLPRAGWKQSLIDALNNGDAEGAYADEASFTPEAYKEGLFPPLSAAPSYLRTRDNLKKLCRDILGKAVLALPPASPPMPPGKRNIEGPGDGLTVLYAKDNGAGLEGCWLGDGMLYAGFKGADTSLAIAREIAHGLFLRDAGQGSLPMKVEARWQGGEAEDVRLISHARGSFPEDHDQHSSGACLMSHKGGDAFCGACLLSLRFYDRVEMQKKEQFLGRMVEGYVRDLEDRDNAAKIVSLAFDPADPDHVIVNEVIPPVSIGREIMVMAVGPERQKSIVNITAGTKALPSDWKVSNEGVASLKKVGSLWVRVTGKAPGMTTLTFTFGGQAVVASITVT